MPDIRVVIAAVLLSACQPVEQAPHLHPPAVPHIAGRERTLSITAVNPLRFPFVEESTAPYVLAAEGGGFFVSWLSKGASAMTFSSLRGGKWFQPRIIASNKLLVNRAEFPSLASGGGALYAQWIERNGRGTRIQVARSGNGGATWSAPITPHPDMVSEFGFASLAPAVDGSLHMIWLDGRRLEGGEEGHGEMELYYARIEKEFGAADGTAIDTRVCDCCQTAMVLTEGEPVIVYRDRSSEETRDIAVLRHTSSGWSASKPLHADGWQLAGCPVNGPQLDASGKNVVAAWFTAARGKPAVYVAFSSDAAATFSVPIQVDSGHPTGHVDVALLPDRSAIVTWIEQKGSTAVIEARRIPSSGKPDPVLQVGEGASASEIGFPRLAVSNDNVLVAWSGPSTVRLATIQLSER